MRVRLGVVASVIAVCASTLCAPLIVHSSTATPTPEVSSPTSVPPAGLSSESPSDSEAALLRAQLEVMRQYDERLLQTVYWALGTAVALVLFAAGAGWYVNFRLYERDKEALRSELRTELESRTMGIRAELQGQLQDTRTSLDDAVKEMKLELRGEADRRSKEIQEAAVQAGTAAVQSLQAQFKEVQTDIVELRYNSLLRDAETWKAKGVYINEMRKCMDALSLAMQLAEERPSADWLMQKPLEGMHGALKAGAQAGVGDLAKITELLGAVPGKYSIQVERLRTLISEAKD